VTLVPRFRAALPRLAVDRLPEVARLPEALRPVVDRLPEVARLPEAPRPVVDRLPEVARLPEALRLVVARLPEVARPEVDRLPEVARPVVDRLPAPVRRVELPEALCDLSRRPVGRALDPVRALLAFLPERSTRVEPVLPRVRDRCASASPAPSRMSAIASRKLVLNRCCCSVVNMSTSVS
jgi:hypothetical protein